MDSNLGYRDIVSCMDGGGEFCILFPAPSTGNFASEKDYLALDLATNDIVFLDEDEVIKINEMEESANPCTPIFDSSLPLLSKVSIEGSPLTGTVVAVNPILLPLNFECEYLIILERGGSVVAKTRDLTILKNPYL